ncbi:hypothetical protein R3P38DRAFT_3216027 [Favolaschia claudopus]|uniref:Uncharacterized protein n=1 Tax=Favolaschia claudopus TaxID=2862362 RepID=A0AAW0A6M3_9AGAR
MPSLASAAGEALLVHLQAHKHALFKTKVGTSCIDGKWNEVRALVSPDFEFGPDSAVSGWTSPIDIELFGEFQQREAGIVKLGRPQFLLCGEVGTELRRLFTKQSHALIDLMRDVDCGGQHKCDELFLKVPPSWYVPEKGIVMATVWISMPETADETPELVMEAKHIEPIVIAL